MAIFILIIFVFVVGLGLYGMEVGNTLEKFRKIISGYQSDAFYQSLNFYKSSVKKLCPHFLRRMLFDRHLFAAYSNYCQIESDRLTGSVDMNSCKKHLEELIRANNEMVNLGTREFLLTYEENNVIIADSFDRIISLYVDNVKSQLSSKDEVQAICDTVREMKKFSASIDTSGNSSLKQKVSSIQNSVDVCYNLVSESIACRLAAVAKDFLDAADYASVVSLLDKMFDDQLYIDGVCCDDTAKLDKERARNIAMALSGVQLLQEQTASMDDCYMMSDSEYGVQDSEFIDYVNALPQDQIMNKVDTVIRSLESGSFEECLDTVIKKTGERIKTAAAPWGEDVLKADMKEIAAYVWKFAMLKPFSVEVFEKVSKLFKGLVKDNYSIDVFLAECYYIKQMGGDDIIRKKTTDFLDERNGNIRTMVKYNVKLESIGKDIQKFRKDLSELSITSDVIDKLISGQNAVIAENVDYNTANNILYALSRTDSFGTLEYNSNSSVKLLTTLASGLMWCQCFDSEKRVLEFILSNKLPMLEKQQERLHALNNLRGNAPKGHVVTSDENQVFFEVESISWRDDEYNGFFANLAFEEKLLSYSVAVRENSKDLYLLQRVTVPALDRVLRKINEVFADEFGQTAFAKKISGCVLSGENRETIDGILVGTSEYPYMSVFINIASVGKKFIVKHYVLYMPVEKTLEKQKQKLFSLYKKMSPGAAMWENSLVDAVYNAVQQLLNELPPAATIVNEEEEKML